MNEDADWTEKIPTHPPSDTPKTDEALALENNHGRHPSGDDGVTQQEAHDTMVAALTRLARTLERENAELAEERDAALRVAEFVGNDWLGKNRRLSEMVANQVKLQQVANDRIVAAEQSLATARADALEEAAKVCDADTAKARESFTKAMRMSWDETATLCANQQRTSQALAERIRALHAAPAPKKEDGNG